MTNRELMGDLAELGLDKPVMIKMGMYDYAISEVTATEDGAIRIVVDWSEEVKIGLDSIEEEAVSQALDMMTEATNKLKEASSEMSVACKALNVALSKEDK